MLPSAVEMCIRDRLKTAHDVGGGGLAAAGLADDADGLAGHELDGEMCIRDRRPMDQNRVKRPLETTGDQGLNMICHAHAGSLPQLSLIHI